MQHTWCHGARAWIVLSRGHETWPSTVSECFKRRAWMAKQQRHAILIRLGKLPRCLHMGIAKQCLKSNQCTQRAKDYKPGTHHRRYACLAARLRCCGHTFWSLLPRTFVGAGALAVRRPNLCLLATVSTDLGMLTVHRHGPYLAQARSWSEVFDLHCSLDLQI